jgi:hypothetical protein
MSSLRQTLDDYLAVRRALGYKLKRDEKLLDQFLTYLEDLGEERVTTKTALAWATLPQGADRSWWSCRLTIVRGFATHLHAIDPATEVPAADLLPWKRCRATPYLYSDDEIATLIAAAETLHTPHRVVTVQSLIGLLVVTGMRVRQIPRAATASECRRRSARLPAPTRSAPNGIWYVRAICLQCGHPVALLQRPVHLPPTGDPSWPRASICQVSPQTPRSTPQLRSPHHRRQLPPWG